MEWVETTGKTLEEAREAALDELGVDEQDAEFEILAEPKLGLFGRVRTEGRLRARVRPSTPRAKDDRRDRRRRKPGDKAAPASTGTEVGDGAVDRSTGEAGDGAPSSRPASTDETAPVRAPRTRTRKPRTDAAAEEAAAPAVVQASAPAAPAAPARRNPSRSRTAAARVESDTSTTAVVPAGSTVESGEDGRGETPGPSRRRRTAITEPTGRRQPPAGDDGGDESVDVALDEQGRVAEEFLSGLLAAFELSAEIHTAHPDEDTVELNLTGSNLGLLIGTKGATLLALQELTRAAVQRQTGAGNGRINVDVSGYRQQRAEALGAFAHKVAADVASSGRRVALEPMAAADRKVVHDALTEVEGVQTISEGEDPQRRVVILPAS